MPPKKGGKTHLRLKTKLCVLAGEHVLQSIKMEEHIIVSYSILMPIHIDLQYSYRGDQKQQSNQINSLRQVINLQQ